MGYVIKSSDHSETVDAVSLHEGGVLKFLRGDKHVWLSPAYWTSVTEGLYLQDAWMGLIKPFVLGFVIVTLGCHVGLRTKGGTQGVGRATTNAVVASSVAVIAVDFFLSRLLITLLF